MLKYVYCPFISCFLATGDTWRAILIHAGKGTWCPKSVVPSVPEWCPRWGQSRSRWYFRCGVCAEGNEDSVIEGLNSVLEQWQMSTRTSAWLFGCQLHGVNLWDRSVRQLACEAQFHLSLVGEREMAFCCRQWEPKLGAKAGSTARIQLFFMQHQEVK